MEKQEVNQGPVVEVNRAIVPVKTAIESLWGKLREVVIEDDRSLQAAVSELATLKAYRQRLEDSRTSLVKPLNEHVKFINSRFKETTEQIDKIEMFVKHLMSDYRLKQEAARIEAERAAREAAAAVATTALELEVAQQMELPKEVTIRTETGAKLTFRKVWRWKVTNMAEVPQRYIIPATIDDDLVGQDLYAGLKGNSSFSIPGFHFYQEEVLAIGGR